MGSDFVGDTPLTRFLATQTLTQLRELRAEYRAELEALRTRMTGLEAELPMIEQAMAEKTGTRKRGSRPTATNGSRPGSAPSLREAILTVMSERPGTWSRQDIYDALRSRRAAPQGKHPKNTLGNRLLEMEKRGEVERSGRGEYALTARGYAFKGSGRNPLLMGDATREAENDSR